MKFKGTQFKKDSFVKSLMGLVLVLLLTGEAIAGTKFIPNKGQWKSNILYKANIPSGAFFLEKDQITYYFFDQDSLHQVWHNFKKSAIIKNQVIRIRFVGSSGATSVDNTGTQSSEYYNYILGNDPSKWTGHVFATDGMTMRNVWPGIDLSIQSSGQGIKYTFHVMPNADPSLIKLQYLGADSTNIDDDNALHINSSLCKIIEQTPIAYQITKGLFASSSHYAAVNAQYQQSGEGIISFKVKKYSHKDTLHIDPIVVFSTFSGSVADNFGFTGTFTPEGNGYSGGTAYAAGFPATTGAFEVKFQGGHDAYYHDQPGDSELVDYGRDDGILKYSPDGTQLIWATYLGGSNNEQPHSMIVNSKGQLVIFGSTISSDFPMINGCYDTHYHGNYDIYISILSEDGSKLMASTYIGGSGRDGFNGTSIYPDLPNGTTGPLSYNYGDAYRGEVIVDNDDNVLVVSCTQSSDLKTVNPFQPQLKGIQDGVVMKLSPDLTKMMFLSYLGGTDQDAAYGIHLDNQQNIFVCGGTQSKDFPTTQGTISPNYHGGIDGFLTKISPDGKSILASTYIGTGHYDQNYLVQTDGADKVYITGQTTGSFPVSQNVYSNKNGKNYIEQIDNKLSTVLTSTVIGTGGPLINLSPTAFLVDLCGRVYLSGWGGTPDNWAWYNDSVTGSTNNLAVTPDAFQSSTNGSNFYLAVLSKNMTNLVYATYFGGTKEVYSEEHVDGGTSRFDRNGIVYQSVCGGCGGYSDFPTTPNAWSRTNKGKRDFYVPPLYDNGGCNNAMFKIDLNSANYPPLMYDTLIVSNVGQTIDYTFKIVDPQGDSVYVSASSVIFNKNYVSNPAVFAADSGIGQVTAHFQWVTDCNNYTGDTVIVTVTAHNNSCPVPRSVTHYIKIVMKKPGVPPPPAMFCIEHIDANTVKVKWTAIPDTSTKNLKEVRLVKQFPNGHDTILKVSSGLVPDSYIDNNAPNNIDTNYYYFLYTVATCGGGSDTGRYAGTVPEKDSIPQAVNIFSVSVENNKSIRVLWNKYPLGNFYNYFVYRKDNDPSSSYKLYATLTSSKDTSFLDQNVDVQTKSYCYKVLVQSQCGILSPDGIYGCSILLTGISVPFIQTLAWNPYLLWTSGVVRYNVYRRDPSKADSIINFTAGNATGYKDDSLDYNEGLYWYHVVARKGLDSNSAMSVSNEIRLVQAPILYVPNAFTPNADETNDKWRTVPVFVKDFHIHVYNRWGEYVWHADDKFSEWDGRYKGEQPSNDCFIWQVEYTGWDNSENYRHGFVTTLP